MQANGQYGVPPEVPQYGVGRGPPSHNHMFNISHDVSLSPSSGHGHPHHGHSSHPHSHHHQQHLQQQHPHHQQQTSQHSQHHTQSQQAQQEHAHQSIHRQHQPPPPNQILPPHHSQDIQQHQMLQQLNLGQESPRALSPIASRPPPNNINKGLAVVTDQSLVLDDHDGLGEEGERGSAGNRWPRQETLALLNIRSDMDAAFRDSSLKGPLWEEISRKLADMGYQRSAKKCKEKFENLHKYYKRTKDGKAGRQDGKSYRFFSQLEALYGNVTEPSNTVSNASPSMFAGGGSRNAGILGGSVIGASGSGQTNPSPLDRTGSFLLARGPLAGPTADPRSLLQAGFRPMLDDSSGLNFSSGSSEDDDEDDPRESSEMPESRKRKRNSGGKLMAFFESQVKKLLEKQEQLQQKFLDALERRDNDRMIREEAWKRQELARLTREHEMRAQERSLAATKDAALVAFLQKVTGQTLQLPPIAIPTQYPVHSTPPVDAVHAEDQSERDVFDPNSKRWPKPEVLALIKLRSDLQPKFADSGPKGPLWQEVSSGMSSLGYSRSAKRCKEKWENINKYFKKAKESSKKRPENAKTCPYFHQLDTLYRKGILGSPTQLKQLPYKVTDLPEDELVSHHQQASGSHTDDISGQVLAIMPPETSTAVAEATTSTTNAGDVAAIHVFSFTGESGASNDGNLKKVKDQPTDHQNDMGSGDVSLAAASPNHDGQKMGAKMISGSHAVRQASSSDLGKQPDEAIRTDSQQVQHDQQQPSTAYHSEYERADLEREAILLEQQKEAQQQNQLQYDPKERPPSLPVTTTIVSSPMAMHVQKLSNDPAPESNISTSANS